MKKFIYCSDSMKYLFTIIALLLLANCAGVDTETKYPQRRDVERREERGRLTGDNGLILFGGKKDDSDEAGNSGIGVNSYLWRASLDTISHMPLASADPFGGVIVTDWYEDPAAKGERMKLNILIMDRKLRSNAVKVSVFRQVNSSGKWQDGSVNPQTARDLEDLILTRARQLKVESAEN